MLNGYIDTFISMKMVVFKVLLFKRNLWFVSIIVLVSMFGNQGTQAMEKEEQQHNLSSHPKKKKHNKEQDDAQIQHRLRLDYLNARNILETVHLLMKATKQNDDYAAATLARMFARGIGVYQDFVEALKYFKIAKKNGNSAINSEIKNIYETLNHMAVIRIKKKNFSAALKFFTILVEEGHADAAYNIGTLFHNAAVKLGNKAGKLENSMKALEWFEKAHQLGDTKAILQTTLQKYDIGTICFQDQRYPEAIKWLTEAYEEDLYGVCDLHEIYGKLIFLYLNTNNLTESLKYADLYESIDL